MTFQNSYNININYSAHGLKKNFQTKARESIQFSYGKVAVKSLLLYWITRLQCMRGLPQVFRSLESESEQSSKEVSNTQVSRARTRKMDSADDDLLMI